MIGFHNTAIQQSDLKGLSDILPGKSGLWLNSVSPKLKIWTSWIYFFSDLWGFPSEGSYLNHSTTKKYRTDIFNVRIN